MHSAFPLCAEAYLWYILGYEPIPAQNVEANTMVKSGSKSGGSGPRTVNKSAVTGKFVSNKTVASSPKTTYKQTTKPCK